MVDTKSCLSASNVTHLILQLRPFSDQFSDAYDLLQLFFTYLPLDECSLTLKKKVLLSGIIGQQSNAFNDPNHMGSRPISPMAS